MRLTPVASISGNPRRDERIKMKTIGPRRKGGVDEDQSIIVRQGIVIRWPYKFNSLPVCHSTETARSWPPGQAVSQGLRVAAQLPTGGTGALKCTNNGDGGTLAIEMFNLTAIEVGSLIFQYVERPPPQMGDAGLRPTTVDEKGDDK